MKDGVRELARQFKAFLQTREEDELTPLSSPQGGAGQTVPAATQTPENTPQDHLTIEFARAAHKETEKQSVGQHPEMHTPEYQAVAAAQNTAPVLCAANAENAAKDLFGQPAPASAAARAEAAQQPQNAPVQEAPVTPQEKQAALDKIAEEIKACRRCPLGQTRIHAVPGEGNPAAELMFIGEGPGFDEDHSGRPFVGRAGQLLDKMIAAMGLKREQVFIGNIAKCHPMVNPENPEARGNDRAPNAGEIAVCRKYIERQIAAISPKYVVALGGVAAKALISDTKSLGALRGRFHLLHLDTVELQTPVKILATYHPAALLRNPNWKKDAWADLQMVMAEMGLKRPHA